MVISRLANINNIGNFYVNNMVCPVKSSIYAHATRQLRTAALMKGSLGISFLTPLLSPLFYLLLVGFFLQLLPGVWGLIDHRG
jgi:hypothetical protein